MSPTPDPRPGDADGGAPLTDAEIEALLAEEGLAGPEAGQPAPEHRLVQREPGEGRFSALLVWLVIAFLVASLVQAFR